LGRGEATLSSDRVNPEMQEESSRKITKGKRTNLYFYREGSWRGTGRPWVNQEEQTSKGFTKESNTNDLGFGSGNGTKKGERVVSERRAKGA